MNAMISMVTTMITEIVGSRKSAHGMSPASAMMRKYVSVRVTCLKPYCSEYRKIISVNASATPVGSAPIPAPFAADRRFEIHKFLDSPEFGTVYSVCIRFGFMEEKNIEAILHELAEEKAINISDHPSEWLVHAIHERFRVMEDASRFKKFLSAVYTFMLNNSQKTDSQYGLGTNINLTVEICPVVIV